MRHTNIRNETLLSGELSLNKKTLRLLMAGVFLVSFGMLAFEVTMTRILSAVLSYHYVFAVISLALLGLGFGAIFDYILRKRMTRLGKLGALPLLASVLALSIPFSVLIMASVANSEALQNDVLLYLLITTMPFFFAGILFAELFRLFPSLSSKLYGMDLLGAATGAIGAIIALNVFGGTKAIAIIGFLVITAALLFAAGAIGKHIKRAMPAATGIITILGLVGTALVGSGTAEIPIGAADKEMYDFLSNPASQGKLVETRWSAFGRTDLVALRNDTAEMVIFTDGTAGTPMYKFNGDIRNPDPKIQSLQTEFPGYLALSSFLQRDGNNALIIGPGGGRDVLLAQMAGFDKITAVEVNPDTVDIVRKYSDYNGGIYEAKNVSVIVDEGRNFLKRQNEKYDAIILSLPVTKTSRSLEGYALTENFLFTTDSIRDYFEHLPNNGRLIVVAHDQVEIIKLLSISLASLNAIGIETEAAMNQVSIIGSQHFPVFILKKTPFEPGEMVSLHQSIHEFGYEPNLSYLPTIRLGSNISHVGQVSFEQCSTFNSLFVAASQGMVNFTELSKYAAASGFDISPVTDNNPFFYKLEAGMPPSVTLVFWLSIITLVIVALVFFFRRNNKTSYSEISETRSNLRCRLLRFIIFFSMLGIGFMLVEISIFQRFILFLGQPVLSLVVMLTSLLLGAGAGSMYSSRFTVKKITRVLIIISPVIAVTLLLYAFVLPLLLNQLLGLDLVLRLLITMLVLLPLGFLMGFPFPLGMIMLKEMRMEDSIPWMWGINGFGSVVGSALTIMAAISYGFTVALLLGAACYLVVFITFLRIRPVEIPADKVSYYVPGAGEQA